MEFCANLTKPPVGRKLAVGHLCVRQLVFWLLVVFSFNYLKMHAWSTCMLLLLNSAFTLSVVKRLLKGTVGGHVLNSHGNYIVDRGKSWKNHGIIFLNFCGNPVYCHYRSRSRSSDRESPQAPRVMGVQRSRSKSSSRSRSRSPDKMSLDVSTYRHCLK